MRDTTIVNTLCPYCNCTAGVIVDAVEYQSWQNGELMQNAMPDLTNEEREILTSGICGDCQYDNLENDYEEYK